MGSNRTELRRQHGDPIQEVLLWAYSGISHTSNCNIPLKGIILFGLSASLKLCKSFIGLLLKIHLGENLLHIRSISQPFFRALSSDYSLELSVGDVEEPCKGFLHYRIGKRTIQLDISPLVSFRAKYISPEKTSIDGPERFLLIGISGFKFPCACKLIDILIRKSKNSYSLVISFNLHSRGLKMSKELLMS